MSFVAITTSGNSQGRYPPIFEILEFIDKTIGIISFANDTHENLAPEKPDPNQMNNCYERNTLSTIEIGNLNLKPPNLSSIAYSDLFDSKFNNKKRLARDYRKWANSTDDLSYKFGKPSNYELDANGSDNDYFYRSYAAGKKEFHKTYPIENYDLEEKDLINIHDLLRPHNEQDISKIFSELKKANLSSNSIQGKTSNRFKKDLFLKFLKKNSSVKLEDVHNTIDINDKYETMTIWKLNP